MAARKGAEAISCDDMARSPDAADAGFRRNTKGLVGTKRLLPHACVVRPRRPCFSWKEVVVGLSPWPAFFEKELAPSRPRVIMLGTLNSDQEPIRSDTVSSRQNRFHNLRGTATRRDVSLLASMAIQPFYSLRCPSRRWSTLCACWVRPTSWVTISIVWPARLLSSFSISMID